MLGTPLLAGCEEPTSVGVNVHGVNYTGDTFSFIVRDPAKPESAAGGELIDPFGAGGITCCVTLPNKWQPGIKLQVHTTHWLPKKPDGSLPEVKEDHVVEVPPYVNGKPGELWVLREADGNVSVISSDVQPDHARWPGKVKGWPVPSQEYRRERWEIYRKHEEGGVRLYESLLADLEKTPETEAKEAWDYAKERDPSSLKEFHGPADPKYRAALKAHYEEGLRESHRRLQTVMEARP
jgi:hypothetical protein